MHTRVEKRGRLLQPDNSEIMSYKLHLNKTESTLQGMQTHTQYRDQRRAQAGTKDTGEIHTSVLLPVNDVMISCFGHSI